MDIVGAYPAVKRPGLYRIPLSGVEVKKYWNCMSVSVYLDCVERETSTFTFTFAQISRLKW
jgi:hypothetical protein